MLNKSISLLDSHPKNVYQIFDVGGPVSSEPFSYKQHCTFSGKRTTTFSMSQYRHHRSVKYILTADHLRSRSVRLNGRVLRLGADDSLPSLVGEETIQPFRLPRRTYGFFVVKNVRSGVCRDSPT